MTAPWPPAGITPYYCDEWTCLVQGDCQEVMPHLADASVDLILTDPPYFRVKDEAWDRQWTSGSAYLAWLATLAQAWQRILKPNGSLYVFASPDRATDVEIQLKTAFHVLNRITWLKDQGWHKKADKGDLRSFLSPWEAVLFAEQYGSDAVAMGEAGYQEAASALHKQVYSPLATYLRQERERAGASRDEVEVALGYTRPNTNPPRGTALCWRWEEGSSLPTKATYERYRAFLNSRNGSADYLRREYEDLRREYEDLRRPFTVTSQQSYIDVWAFPTVPATPGKHPCEKPLALLEHIITCSSRPGAVILDSFAGSGSTLDAAKRLGRRAIGIEQEAHWCRQAAKRLRQEVLPLRYGSIT